MKKLSSKQCWSGFLLVQNILSNNMFDENDKSFSLLPNHIV